MSDQESDRDLAAKASDEQLDTEGQAVKWELLDQKGKPKHHQSWTPDEPNWSQRGADALKGSESQKKPR